MTDQKQQHVDVHTELLQLISEDETFLLRVIISNGSWIYGYDLDMKQQIIPLEKSRVTKTKRGQTFKKQCQEHGNRFQ